MRVVRHTIRATPPGRLGRWSVNALKTFWLIENDLPKPRKNGFCCFKSKSSIYSDFGSFFCFRFFGADFDGVTSGVVETVAVGFFSR